MSINTIAPAVKTETKPTAKFIANMQAIGGVIANAYAMAENQADTTKRELLLKVAEAHATNSESVKYILEGFASKFEALGYSASIAKVRKSEANQVFKAVALTAISNDNLKTLTEFKGTYHAFIDCARGLQDKAKQADKPKSNVIQIRPLTDNQKSVIVESLKKANIAELENVTNSVMAELSARADSGKALIAQFTLLANIASAIAENANNSKASIDCANSIFKLANIHANKLEKEMAPIAVAVNQ